MRIYPSLSLSLLLLAGLPISAQEKKESAKETKVNEAEEARKSMNQILKSVEDSWFGEKYKGITSVKLNGDLTLNLTGAAVDAKVAAATKGVVQANSKGANVKVHVDTLYFANADFRTEMKGDFGNLLYTRRGPNGYLYSKEQNSYTTGVDLAPANTPETFLVWFKEVISELRGVYVEGKTFQSKQLGQTVAGGKTLQRISFSAPTGSWDPKKREQPLAETLGFWKRGVLELSYDPKTSLPYTVNFKNEAQGVSTHMNFSYGEGNKLQAVSIANESRGFEGPGRLNLGYDKNGRISTLVGELTSQSKKVAFDLNLTWSGELKHTAVNTVPPPGAKRVGRDEMETQLLLVASAKIMDLQKAGMNFRAFAISPMTKAASTTPEPAKK